MNQKILLVDDEIKVLQAYERNLSLDFEVVIEPVPRNALAIMENRGPFAVVLSDYKMPDMNGVDFLSEARRLAPDTVRIMLTGYADLEKTIKAVNEGSVFRFLTKPCPLLDLMNCLNDAVRQYQLVTSERELLDKTLNGSVQTLLEILSILNASAFSLAQKRRRAVRAIGKRLGSSELWTLDLAAMLCEIGLVTLPEKTLASYLAGDPLDVAEQRMVENLPAVSAKLVEKIPRLEKVAEIIRYQRRNFKEESTQTPQAGPSGRQIPLGARILKALNEYYRMTAKGQAPSAALDILELSSTHYDPQVIAAMRVVPTGSGAAGSIDGNIRKVYLTNLLTGHTLRSDVLSKTGDLILRAGQTLGPAHIQRLRNFADSVGVQEPFLIET